ncbi:MAG: Protein of unknown function precursor [Bacteroidetes bacterium]|nr:Protein of unknown function precursor [Bacteroidota bacterium]
MNYSLSKITALLSLLLLFSLKSVSQTSIPNTTAITQNFDGMGTGTTTPSNWEMQHSATPTWAGGTTALSFQFSSGSPATGGSYNWGTTAATDRALGVMTSGSYTSPSSVMAYFKNTNASTLTQLAISYDLERYRINTAAASVQFFYSTDGSTWTAATAGDVAAATIGTGANAYSFSPQATFSVSTFNITGLSSANGSDIYLRWNLNTTGSNSQGIGIDNVSVTASFGTLPSITVTPTTLTGFNYLVGNGPSSSQSYNISGTNLTGAPSNLLVTGSTDYEVSADNITFGATANIPYAAATLAATPVYVRLKAGLAAGSYNSESVITSGGGAVSSPTVTCSGTVSNPGITVTPATLTGFTYVVSSGPSTNQTFTVAGSVTAAITLTPPTDYEISLASGSGFGSSITLTPTGTTVATTTIYVRLKAGLAVATYNTETIVASSTGATSQNVTCNGTVTASATSDLITAGGEPLTISSTVNTNSPLTSATGVQVWQITVRDGGATLSDADNLPTIVNAITIAQVSNTVSSWLQAIKTIELFDGSTNVGIATVTGTQIQFTGLNISVTDNTSKTLSLRMSLNCGIGASNFDADHFGFSISSTNLTLASSGSSQKAAFTAAQSATGKNVIDVTATQLQFTQQPTTTGDNTSMTPAVTVTATDACGNTDLGFTGTITITSTGTLTGSPVTATAAAGVATFSSVTHTAVGTGFTLTASATSLSSATSSLFDITTVTNFGPGDIAIVGMCVNMNSCGGAGGEDEISFVSFEDITPGTTIDLTDNGFERVGCGSNTWGNTEGVVRITRTTSTIPKGTVITLRILDQTVFTPLQPDASWTVTYPNSGFGTFNLNGTDEQVYIMQGGTWNKGTSGAHNATYTGGILMFGINTYTAWTCNDNLTTRGNLPAVLKCFSILPGIATANIKYTGPVTPASQKDWVDRLNSTTNWSGTATCAAYSAGGLDYGAATQVYSIINSGFNAGQWTGAANTDWFDCNNWQNFKIPDVTTNVVVDQTATNDCEVGVTAGTAVCSTLALNSNSAVVKNLVVKNTSTLNVGGNVAITKTVTNANLSLSLLNTATFSCNNLTITGIGSGLENAQFQNKFNTTTATINGNLVLNTGAQLDLTNTGNYGILHLKGNYTNNDLESIFKQTNSIVYFDGTGAQSISTNSFNEIFGNIVMNKTAGSLTLNNPVEIENNVNFTSGLINSTATNLLIFDDNASATNASNTSYTNGPVRKVGNDAFIFPVGKAAQYAPATIGAPGTVTDHFTAEYFSADPDPIYNRTLKDPTIDHISECEYWIINRTNGSSNVNVTLSWNTPRSCSVSGLPDLLVARWDGTMWKDHGNGGTTGSTSAGTVITSAAVTAFSPFTLASISALNPLPIELLSFKAKANDNTTVLLNWSTATEINNDFFTLERSENALDFTPVTKIKGAGNSTTQNNYNYTDKFPVNGINYYRLKQTDFDGKTSYSGIVSATITEALSQTVYPNPATDQLNIRLSSAAAVSFEITDLRGVVLFRSGEQNPDKNIFTIELNTLPAGTYILKSSSNGATKQTLFIKQ